MTQAHPRNKLTDARGVGKLAIDATLGLANLVETLHHNIASAAMPLGKPVQAPMRGIPGMAYRAVRGATRGIGWSIDLLLGALAPLLAQEPSSARREALVSAINGVLGDHLAQTGNPLAIPMRLRSGGIGLELTKAALGTAIAAPSSRVLVLVHGLCLNDLKWRRNDHDHGAALVADAAATRPLTPLYLHYNSGRHVSANGREFADLLEALVQAWPVPMKELVIVGHSMGGLVARSAWHYGKLARHRWPSKLKKLVFLGTPHAGAPLERGGNWVNRVLDASPYTTAFARLGKIRSAGITDLRHGSLLDGDWESKDRFGHAKSADEARTALALPEGVACFALAASTAKRAGTLKERLLGDGLVPLASALGHGAAPGGGALFAKSHEHVVYGVNHLGLLDSKAACRKLRQWIVEE